MDNTQPDNAILTWLEQQATSSKLTGLALLYLACVRPTQELAREVHREFLLEVEEVARDETAPVSPEERTVIGYVLALRDALVGQEGREIHPPSATTRQEGGNHED